tara:strand:- start:242 stop:430 length:189 start_codon:yes stop_codon:yes gene_type:complete
MEFYYILFGVNPPSDFTLAEVLAEIYERNPQVYDMLAHALRRTNVDKLYPIKKKGTRRKNRG